MGTADESDSLELDLLAASLRADMGDIAAFVEGLAVKLEESLPGVVQVERVKQGFRGPKLVRKIALNAGTGERLELRREGDRVQTLTARTSGGIVLKTEAVDIDTWLASLTTVIAAEAGRNAKTREALERPLDGIDGGGEMGFLDRLNDPNAGAKQAPSEPDFDPAAPVDAPHAEDYRAGALAGLPDSGRERLQRMKQDIQRGFFTSDLSVNEFLLVKEAGFEPLGLVLGSSIYHIGLQMGNWNQNMELGVLTQAMYHARELAMTRMEEEADQLGADGVVGVRLTIGRYEWGADMAEFIAVGTAVRHAGGELHRAPNGRPFTSDLSGQDFSTLLRAGYRPVGLVMGNCVYHVAQRGMLQALRQVGRNMEMTNFTQALYEARELAMGRMQTEAEEIQAGGLVGVKLNQASHGWGSHVIEFMAIATAVIPTRDDHVIEKPALVLPLTG